MSPCSSRLHGRLRRSVEARQRHRSFASIAGAERSFRIDFLALPDVPGGGMTGVLCPPIDGGGCTDPRSIHPPDGSRGLSD